MKKIINRKTYNTETAKEIASWSNRLPRHDFGFCNEILYQTKKGQFFLHGDGGAMSKYAKRTGSTQYGSEDIVLLTEVEAMDWLEKHDETDVLEKLFPEEIEEG